MEHQLLTCDAQIKSNLGLESADTDKCISAMEEMLNLPIDPLMLKKHSHIVETIKRVIFKTNLLLNKCNNVLFNFLVTKIYWESFRVEIERRRHGNKNNSCFDKICIKKLYM